MITKIQRIFNNREVRKNIGLDITNEETFTIERMKLVVEASKWVVKESESTGIAVTRLFNKAKVIEDKLVPWIQEYSKIKNTASDTPGNGSSSKDKSEHKNHTNEAENNSSDVNKQHGDSEAENTSPTPSTESKDDNQKESKGNASNGDSNAGGGANTGSGGNKNLPYFFQGLSYGALNPNDVDTHGVTAVCRELQLFSDRKLVAVYPLASAFLVRSIIEQAIKYYSKKHKIQGQNKYIWEDIKDIDKLSKIISKYNKNLPNYIVDSGMRQYFTALFGDYEKNVDPLNWVIHRPSEFRLDANTLIELPKKGLLALINFMIA